RATLERFFDQFGIRAATSSFRIRNAFNQRYRRTQRLDELGRDIAARAASSAIGRFDIVFSDRRYQAMLYAIAKQNEAGGAVNLVDAIEWICLRDVVDRAPTNQKLGNVIFRVFPDADFYVFSFSEGLALSFSQGLEFVDPNRLFNYRRLGQ